MVQTTNRFFDEAARLMNDAAGVAQGVRREFETLFRSQAERILRELAVVHREEFEAVKDMARLAREENEALKARIAALEARLAGSNSPAAAPADGRPSRRLRRQTRRPPGISPNKPVSRPARRLGRMKAWRISVRQVWTFQVSTFQVSTFQVSTFDAT